MVKRMLFLIGMCLACLMVACKGNSNKQEEQERNYGEMAGCVRDKIRFNTEWLYSPVDYKNGEEVGLIEEDFEQVSIPHANKILSTHKGPNFQEQIESYRFVSWYRRHFVLGNTYKDKNIIIEFEGVASVAEVYVNGQFVGEHKGAYTSFSYDITKYLNPIGEDNVISVRVDSTKRADIPPEGGSVDYCLFGGIVRDVWIIATGESYIANTFASTPDISNGNGKVNNETTIRNTKTTDAKLCVETYLVDATGKAIAKGSVEQTVKAGEELIFKTETESIKNPILWETTNPYLYTVVTRVLENGKCIDDLETRIGFRWFEFVKDGFYLNGKKIELIGVNRHEQWPYLGRAVNDKYQIADADLIKKTGFNAVRCSHYPQDPAFLDRCDEIGLIVFEEAPGWQYVGDEAWKEVYKTNIEEMIIRDRNHPSIVSWGTRVNESFDDDALYNETNDIAKKLDATRPTHGVRRMESYNDSTFLEGEDIYTINYQYPTVPKNMPFIITEHSMDWYEGNGFSWAMDERALKFTKSFASVVDYYYGNKYCLGGFAWSMFDYNNEVNYTRTDNVFYSGMYDIFRIEKMPAFFYMSQKDAKESPMVYIANYWADSSVKEITVMSNCDEVELYINGKLIEKIKPNSYKNLPHPLYVFKNIKYEEGEITAVGYVDGKEVARHTRKTPKKASKIILTPDYSSIVADGSDFTSVKIELVDENGCVLPYADNEVKIEVTGEGRFIGEERLKLEGGSAAFYVASNYLKKGTIYCTVSSDGVTSGTCEIKVEDFTEKTLLSLNMEGNVEGVKVEEFNINDTSVGSGLNRFIYSGNGWDSALQPGCFWADNHFSKNAGDFCTFKFEGTGFKLYSSVAPTHGIMKICIDGEKEETVDLYCNVRKDGVVVYCAENLENKEHTIKITVTGKKNAKATDYYVTVDNIKIMSGKKMPTVEEKYALTTDAIWSDGYANNGSTYEWAIKNAPQCAYVANIDFDTLASISLRMGHEINTASISIYAYDNGGEPLTKEDLKNLSANKELLGEPIAVVKNGKKKAWGYQTVYISEEEMLVAEGDGYFTIEEGSQNIRKTEGMGEKALIIYVDGNIGSMAYYDYIKLEFYSFTKY